MLTARQLDATGGRVRMDHRAGPGRGRAATSPAGSPLPPGPLLQAVLAASDEPVLALAADGTVELVSSGAVRLLGPQRTPCTVLDLLDPAEVSARAAGLGVPPGLEAVLGPARAGAADTWTWTLLGQGGRRTRLDAVVCALRDDSGVAGFLVTGAEVGGRPAGGGPSPGRDSRTGAAAAPGTAPLAARLRESDERFRLTFDDAPIGMALVDARREPGRFLRVNQALCRITGRSAADLLDSTQQALTHPDDEALGTDEIALLRTGEREHVRVVTRYVHADGHAVWVSVTSSLVRGPDGRPDHLVVQVEDLSERRRSESELQHQALHDALTGLPNRALLRDHVQQALARAARDHTSVAVLFLDVDDFTVVNDSLGHDAGDRLLTALAERIHGCLRDTDTAARFGGDEFVVVAGDLAGVEECDVVADRLALALVEPVDLDGHRVTPSVSVGIATSTASSTVETLLRDANAAVYRAKRAGKGRSAQADTALTVRALRQLSTETDLRRGLSAGELRLLYQPAVDLRTGQVESVEALLRWQHPTRGLLLPADFLDVVEGRDLIVPLGQWVLQTACEQARLWHLALGAAAPRVWVNVSSRQLGRHDLSALVARTLSETGLPPAQLGLELTERQTVGVAPAVRADLEALPAMGVALALDDFGTGHNGFDHLRTMPLDTLKVDQSFVAGLDRDPTDSALVAGIVAMGRALGLTVVAEGVETTAQWDRLAGLGCHQAQGYLLARPLPAGEVVGVLGRDLRVPRTGIPRTPGPRGRSAGSARAASPAG